MDGNSRYVIDGLLNVEDEESEVTTDYLSDEKGTETTTSDDGSSTQFCSISTGPVKDTRAFQRHPSVDEWLQGLSISKSPEEDKFEIYVEDKVDLTPPDNLNEEETVEEEHDKLLQTNFNKLDPQEYKKECEYFQTCDVREFQESLSKPIENKELGTEDLQLINERSDITVRIIKSSDSLEEIGKDRYIDTCQQSEIYENEIEDFNNKNELNPHNPSQSINLKELVKTSLSELNCLKIREATEESKFEECKITQTDLESEYNQEKKHENGKLPNLKSFKNNLKILNSSHENTDKESSFPKQDIPVIQDIKQEDQVKSSPKPRIRKTKSLKTCRTPPGNRNCPKLVRFADILGLDLSETRVFADEIPKIPKAAFEDLNVDKKDNYWSNTNTFLPPAPLIPHPTQLVPMFTQPGMGVHFLDSVFCHKICLQTALMTGPTTLTGDVRVLNVSYDKVVTVKWTVDDWANVMVTCCVYVPGDVLGTTDKFRFLIETAGLAVGSRVHLCLKYESGGQVFWDNNGGQNYVFKVKECSENRTSFEQGDRPDFLGDTFL
eukprot:GFUD01073649.1.p1 GENE.GFUD01073649.1~~GFUD01073649.1.p1  ORF type:complete len:550 (+),score=146.60 GFUD01073649.1:158-1807(+)